MQTLSDIARNVDRSIECVKGLLVEDFKSMTNRQARIKRLKEAFQKVEQLMKDGYVVQWDCDPVVKLDWRYGLCLGHEDNELYTVTVMYENNHDYEDFADLPIDQINKELSERLTVWKRVEVKL